MKAYKCFTDSDHGGVANAKDARVEELWKSLHTGPIKPLDLKGLREGLRKIDHRMFHALRRAVRVD